MAAVDSQNKFSIDKLLQKGKNDCKDSCETKVDITNDVGFEGLKEETDTMSGHNDLHEENVTVNVGNTTENSSFIMEEGTEADSSTTVKQQESPEAAVGINMTNTSEVWNIFNLAQLAAQQC